MSNFTSIMNLEPGEEMDALIAENIMGWKKGGYMNMMWTGTGWFQTPHGSQECDPFSPSTDIASAWVLVEKMIKDGWEVSEAGYSMSLGKWDFTFGNGCSFPGPLCDTAPEAICKAAWAAVFP